MTLRRPQGLYTKDNKGTLDHKPFRMETCLHLSGTNRYQSIL